MSNHESFPPEEPKAKISERFPDYVPPTKITYVGGKPVTLHLRKCRLQLKDGDEWGREFISDKNVITVGSVDDNDLVVKDDTVSRYHCKIIEDNQSYLLVDLNSTNGTFVNRVRVREAFLKPGSLVTLGKTEMRFQAMDEKVEIQPSAKEAFGGIIGRAEKIREIFGILEKISPTGVTVVIEGETGTGKEVVARAIHNNSPRKAKPFMVFDCGAVPENLIESELFGHEKGSFTGAVMTRQGLFEMANGGTIFLDELGELNLDLQPKLLRVLEQREVKRVGSNKSIPIDVRVIAATNRTLEKEVREGRFREDLFYRLSVVRIFMPPLRDRKEDIPLLIKHFLRTMTFNRDETGKPRVTRVDRGAIEVMKNYDWPGNVRELLNVVERACSFADEGVIASENLPIQLTSGSQPRAKVAGGGNAHAGPPEEKLPFKEAKEKWVSSFERDYILGLLKKNNMNISHAAREADIDRKYFRKLMKKYGIDASDYTE